MRHAFINTLFELAKKDKKIFLLNGDLGFSVLEKFNAAYPDRSFNMGVAEANMMGVAAGLALSGKTVFVYSIIPFVTFRVFEQIRNDVAMQNANVKIVGVGSGWTYSTMGATHHSIEDIGIMRAIPGITVIAPGDPYEAMTATKAVAQMKGPCYLRLSKKGDPLVHKNEPNFAIGKAIQLTSGRNLTLIATGNMLPVGKATQELLARDGLKARLISMHTVKPLDERTVLKAARETPAIFTLEEHNIMGGLGSAVAEVLAENSFGGVFRRFGAQDEFTHIAGSHDFVRSHHKLLPSHIAQQIKKIFRDKN